MPPRWRFADNCLSTDFVDKWEALTHGSLGIINIAPPEGFGLIDFTETVPFYYLVLFFLVLAIVLVSRISSSLVGRTFLAIRISDDLAQSLGINLMRNKVLAFVLSTVYAGLAGGLYAGVVRFIGPAEAEVVHTFDIITYLLVGGIGTLMGPLVGTMMITWLTQAVQSFEEYRMIVFGPMLVLLVIFMPKGVVGTFLTWRGRRLASKAPAKEGQTRVGDSATSSKEASDNA